MLSNKNFTSSLKKYPLLPEQKSMLENLIPMFRSKDPEIIDFARNIILNEPLLDIICGTPTCKQNAKTLHIRVSHCKFKKLSGSGNYSIRSLEKVFGEYYYISIAMEATLKYEYYYMLK